MENRPHALPLGDGVDQYDRGRIATHSGSLNHRPQKCWDSEPLWRHFWKTDALYYKLGRQIG